MKSVVAREALQPLMVATENIRVILEPHSPCNCILGRKESGSAQSIALIKRLPLLENMSYR